MSQYLTNITGDVFGLNYIYDRLVDNIENRNFFYWREDPVYGYIAGGLTPSATSSFYRLDYANELVTNPTSKLLSSRYHHQAISSSSYGYWTGGFPDISSIDRLDFSNETVSNPGFVLSGGNTYLGGSLSSANYGWVGGGIVAGAYSALVQRLDFSSETTSNPGKNLSITRQDPLGVSSPNYGYFGGGFFSPAPTWYARVDRLDLFTESTINIGDILPNRASHSTTYSLLYGYYAGGINGPVAITTISRLDFSVDTFSSPGKNFSGTLYDHTSTANSRYGYFSGGISGPVLTTITRLDFETEVLSNPGKNLTNGLYVSARTSVSGGGSRLKDNQNYGYFAGGFAPPQISTITRLNFSNDTVSDPGQNLPTARSELAAVASNSYGYFGGGFAPPQINTITRLDFLNETIYSSVGNLPSNRRLLTATESGSYGYWAGGFSTPTDNYFSTITRFDFATEIATNTPTNLPSGRRDFASNSTNFYAYFGGGFDGTSFLNTISRLDFSNETASNPGNNLTLDIRGLSSFKSYTYGYFGGGEYPGPTPFSISNILRLDYSSETISNPGNLLSTIRRGTAATSSRIYGYFAGGFSPSYISTVTRLDFSNEVLSNPTSTLPSARANFTGLTNSN